MDILDQLKDHQLFLRPSSLEITREEILRFDSCRRIFEERLENLDPTEASNFYPIRQWMRLMISTIAPELLEKGSFDEL